MSEERIYQELPADPEQAFLLLEQKYREDCERHIFNSHQNERTDIHWTNYIAQVIGTIQELGLETEFSNKVPRIEDVSYNTYLEFRKDVEYYLTKIKIRHGRRVQGYSVRFDAITKGKIRHHLNQVRDIVQKLEIEQDKRDALLNKISALELEVDRDRTRFDAFGDAVIALAGILGESAEKLEPVRKHFDTIGKLIWGAKKEEETKQLPPPAEPKQIEPPRASKQSEKKDDLDDEIPF